MPPLIYLVRHAEGENNINDSHWIPDAVLTPKGKQQCAELKETFPFHNTIQVVMSSPLRRAVQTAALSFGPTISRPGVEYLLVPMGQEASGKHCDRGQSRNELEKQLPGLVEGDDVGFDLAKVDYSLLEDGWNFKTGKYAPDAETLRARAAGLRAWLFQRPESHILFVTHGAFLHYLTEDWTGDDHPTRGTAYLNCEVRIFDFVSGSNKDEAHIVETQESKGSRVRHVENDESVLAELKEVERK